MSRIWQILLGIEPRSPAPSPAGESTRLELTALPRRGDGPRCWRRRSSPSSSCSGGSTAARSASCRRRGGRGWSALRALVLLAVAVMLVEPVLVSSHRETVRSHLPIIVDDSESMRFSDPYTDETRAAATAAALKLQGAEREVAGGPAARDAAAGPGEGGDLRARSTPWARAATCSSTTWSRPRRPVTAGPARAKPLEEIQPKRPVSPLGDALQGVLAAHRGQPVAGIVLATDGRSNTGEDPLRVAEAAARQNIPIFPDRRRGRRGPAERPARRDRGQPGRLRPRPDDAGRRRRGPRAAATPRRPRPRAADQRRRLGAGRQPADRPGRGRHPQADDVPDHAQGGRPVRVSRPGRGRRAGADPGRQLATAAVRVVRQQIRVLLIAGVAVAGGPVPPQRAAARPARRVRRLAPARRPRLPPAGRPADHAAAERRGRARPLRRAAAGRPRHAGPRSPVARHDHELRRPGGRRPDLRRRRALLAAALRVGRRRRVGRRPLDPHPARRPRAGPVPHRGRGAAHHPVDLHPGADARGARRPDLRVPPRPDPQPRDPDEPARHVLELPRHPRPARRHGAGPARRPADAEPVRPARAARLAALRAGPDGLHRLRQHLSLALSLGRLLRRLLGPPGRPRRAGTRRWAAGSRSR